ncbi:histidine kinase [Rhodobacteraceae bacterium S2214]|nr:histidine kinase [Rhodobacteraceae bacterium S2214]
MNIARLVIGGIIMSAIAAGIALYYLQVYAYYEEVTLQVEDVQMTSLFTGEPEPILFENFNAIDSDSSPLRFRACFDTSLSFGFLTETYEIYDAAEPLNAPGWFDCFQAGELGDDLSSGVAVAFMGIENIQYGIDRVIAVYPDGRAFAWHQINECGEVVFDGNRAPEHCPPAPERLQ